MTKLMKKLPTEASDLYFDQPILNWDEALPLGNGLLGSLLWGGGESYRMSIDRGDLWDSTSYEGVQAPEFRYEELVRLAQAGNTERIRQIFDAPYYNVTPTKLPAGKLLFAFSSCEKILSRLRLATAEAEVAFIQGNRTTLLRSFLHAGKRAGLIRVTGPFQYRVERPDFGLQGEQQAYQYDEGTRSITNSLQKLAYPAPEVLREGEFTGFQQTLSDKSAYALLAASRKHGEGTPEEETEIAFTVACSWDGPDWLSEAKGLLTGLLDQGYRSCLMEHESWWADFWSSSAVTLPEPLFESNWYRTNYLLGSCSRKGCPPMPLQGVWTADNGELPPWKGDYHHDLNTQMCYYHYLKANHLNAGESFLDFLWELRPRARQFAKEFYGTEGLCLPAVMTLQGEPLGGWAMYSLSPTNQLWLCQLFERHYTYTGDREFLLERAYPYLKETAQMILGLLKKDNTGEYKLPVSSSPEIHDDTQDAWVTPNSNYDLALLHYLFQKLVELSVEVLGSGNSETERWQEVWDHLPELAAGKDGVLWLSPDEALDESHRHHAHAMSIHPLRLLDPDEPGDRRKIDATVADLERLGTGWWVGYSFTWFAEFFAVQRNGEGAAEQLRLFWESFCSPNGFHLNGDYRRRGLSSFHYRPFTLEGNMCAADVLQEMLLRSEKGTVELFPAIPDNWKTLSFVDFRGERGLLVSASLENGALKGLTLKAETGGSFRITGGHGLEGLVGHLSGWDGASLSVKLAQGDILKL